LNTLAIERSENVVDFRKEPFDGSAVAEDGTRDGPGLRKWTMPRVSVEDPRSQATEPAQPSGQVDATTIGEAKVENTDIELLALRLRLAARVCHHDSMAVTGKDMTDRSGHHLAGLHQEYVRH